MRHIQDKDFDQLFKVKLIDEMVTPPASAWTNIEKQLEPKRKRILPVYWMAAAVVMVAVTVGLLFHKEEKIQLQGNTAIATKIEKPLLKDEYVPPVDTGEVLVKKSKEVIQLKKPVKKADQKKELLAMQPIHVNGHLTIKRTTAVKMPIPELKVSEEVLTTLKNDVALVNIDTPSATTENVTSSNDQIKTKGIRNIGDLVNFVVEKVDKRDQKFLKFRTDDDDNSSLVAINIGIIKFNARNKSKR